ncbi:MAG: hypothetical protein WC149_00120 [Arcobacteraceae bacterium]
MEEATYFLIGAFLVRIVMTFWNNNRPTYSFTSDENGHLAHERLLAQKNNLTQYLTKHLFNRTSIGYPNLFHHVARILFKEDYDIVKRRYLSGFFSVLFPILFFLIGINYYNYDTVAFVTIALLLSLATFGDFISQYKSYTGRSLADFILLCGYFFIVLYVQTNDIIYYLLAIFFFSLVWFSSEFGIQSIVLTSILWSTFSKNTVPLEILILSVLVATIISKEKVQSNVGHKIFHWIWYFRNQAFLHEKIKLDLKSLIGIYKAINSNVFLGKFLQYIPFVFLFVYIAVSTYDKNSFLSSLIVSTFIIALLSTNKFFSFLGPGFRYMLYVIPFMWILLYETYQNLSWYLLLIESLLSSIYAFLVIRELYKNKNTINYSELDQILEKIDKEGNIILMTPTILNQSFFSRTNNIQAKYFSIWDNDFNPYYLHLHETYMTRYPFLTNDLNKLHELKYEVAANILVINLSITKGYYSEEFLNEIRRKNILYISDNFLVVDL